MNLPEHELARKIVQHLDYGTDRMESGTRERLFAARRTALSHYRERPEAALGLAWAGQAAAWITGHRYGTRHWMAVAALALALAGVAYWKMTAPVNNEIAEIEMGLLSDELPINAYLDKGFDSWLKRSSR
ncbi:MAG: DUF3619 family protein [Betaproteobacteria bacterium]|nr:DUF3619 family protein [Betaproteobacteria bacterium]